MGVSKQKLAGGRTAWRARAYDLGTKKMVSLGTYRTKRQATEVYEARKALEQSGASSLEKSNQGLVDPVTNANVQFDSNPKSDNPFFGAGELQDREPPRRTFAQRLKDLFRIK